MQIIRRTPIDSRIERQIIIGLIVSDQFCESIIPILKENKNLLRKSFTGTIFKWIIEYWDNYGKAPGKTIEDIFSEKKGEIDGGNLAGIEEFLSSISLEYEAGDKFDADYILKKAIDYLELAQIEDLRADLTKCIIGKRTEDARKLIQEFTPIRFASESGESKGFTLKELEETEKFSEVKWIIDGIIPVGLTLFAGKPKTGKSSLVFNLAIDVSLGREAFDSVPTDPMETLYLALEDSQQRVKFRQNDILRGDEPPEICTVFTQGSWAKLGSGGLQKLEKWMKDHPETKLIIIDTLQKVRNPRQKRPGRSYADDYRSLEPLQEFSGNHEIAIIVIHHTRKTKAEDVFDEISGTTGLAAVADTLVVMSRVPGKEKDRILDIRGRDFQDKTIVFSLISSYRWKLKGDASEFLDSKLDSKQRQAIVDYLNLQEIPVQRKEIIEKTKNKIGKGGDILIKKLVAEGKIEKIGYGVYAREGFTRDLRLSKVAQQAREKLQEKRKFRKDNTIYTV